MRYLHSELAVDADQAVHVTLAGNAANVLLLDDGGFERYEAGEAPEIAAGGYYRSSPVILRPPRPGRWHLVIDLAGRPGEVNASVTLRPDHRG